MKREYKSPKLKARELSMHLMIDASEISVGGNTDHFDAKENTIFDRFGNEEAEE